MTDPNPMRITEEMRRKRAAATSQRANQAGRWNIRYGSASRQGHARRRLKEETELAGDSLRCSMDAHVKCQQRNAVLVEVLEKVREHFKSKNPISTWIADRVKAALNWKE